jgi:hypothetical protein
VVQRVGAGLYGGRLGGEMGEPALVAEVSDPDVGEGGKISLEPRLVGSDSG